MQSYPEKSQSKVPEDKTVRGAIALRMNQHFKLMGIQLPDDKQSQREFISNYNQMICERNPSFPHDVQSVKLYHDFFNAIETGMVEKPIRNAFAYGQAFREWAKSKDIRAIYGLPNDKQLEAPKDNRTPEELYQTQTDQQLEESQLGLVALIEQSPRLVKAGNIQHHIKSLMQELLKREITIHPILMK